MSTWRRKAIELFPDLRQLFSRPETSPYDVFFELLPRCREAHERNDEAELAKIYGYATWCARQPAKTLWNPAGVSFYEHIVDCPQARQEFHRWVEPDVFDDVSSLLEWRLGPERFRDLAEAYANNRVKKGR